MSKKPSGTARRMSPALIDAAEALRRGSPEEAVNLAAAVMRAERGNLAAVEILASGLLAANRPHEALEPLRNAARRSQDPVIEHLLAEVLMATGQTVEAVDQWRRAVTRRPPHPVAFLALSEVLSMTGRLEEAAEVLDQALDLMPAADGLRIALGNIHLRRNDRERARAAFQHVRIAAPGRRDAMIALARLLVLECEYSDAAELYQEALRLLPQDPPSRISLGKCLLELGRRQEGEAMIRQATQQGPEFAGLAVGALAAASHGRFFLRPSAARAFLQANSSETKS